MGLFSTYTCGQMKNIAMRLNLVDFLIKYLEESKIRVNSSGPVGSKNSAGANRTVFAGESVNQNRNLRTKTFLNCKVSSGPASLCASVFGV